jgi:hypothetical protein
MDCNVCFRGDPHANVSGEWASRELLREVENKGRWVARRLWRAVEDKGEERELGALQVD